MPFFRFFSVLLLFFFGAVVAHATETPIKNAGFVPANIWYSKDPFFADDKVRIYTVIFNGSANYLTGTVEFLDNGTLIDTTEFSLASGGRVRDVWVDWVAKEGTHIITARLAGVTVVGTDGKRRTIVLEHAETGKSERVIDRDTDSDSVGNADDTDDDGDGVSDIDELQNGTDPLDKRSTALATSTTTDAGGAISDTIAVLGEKLPEPIKEVAVSGVNVIERFRVGEGYKLRLAREAKEQEIQAINDRRDPVRVATSAEEESILETTKDATEKPVAYLALALLAVSEQFFEWKVLFYGVFAYILYRIVKWVVNKVRNRQD